MSVLFNIQKNSRKKLWAVGGAFITLLVIIILTSRGCNKNSFLKYSNKDYYTPADTLGSGFTGKVNAMLERALKDTYDTAYNIEQLNSFYKRLKFRYPLSSNVLNTLENIRLDTFICDPKVQDESNFYFNSYLKDVIEEQRKHPDRRYFHIHIDRNDSFKIKSITIDPSLYKLQLSNSAWKGNINYSDPFEQIDTNSIFLIFQNKFLPVFSSTPYYKTRANFMLMADDNNFYKDGLHDTFSLSKDLKWLFQKISKDSMPLRVCFTPNFTLHSPTLIIKNQPSSCALEFTNFDSGYIYFKKGNIVPITNNHDTLISHEDLPAKVQFKQGARFNDFIISNNSPLAVASTLLNPFSSEKRAHPNDAYTDLFCKQFIYTLDNNLSQKTSGSDINTSLNPLLSSHLENEMINYIKEVINRTKNESNPEDEFQMSMCLIDNRTGEIIAAPFYTNKFDQLSEKDQINTKNFNLTKHFIGSTFKPLLANAATIKFPSLSGFRLSLNDGNTFIHPKENDCKILGYPISPFSQGLGYSQKAGTAPPFWGKQYNNMSRVEFLRQSHDLYPIELGMLALTEPDDPSFQTINGQNVADHSVLKNLFSLNQSGLGQRLNIKGGTIINDMAHSSLFYLMSKLYDVYLTNIYDKQKNNWNYRYDSSFLPVGTLLHYADAILPEAVSLNADILGADDSTNNFTDFSTWVLGQGKNEWNNLKLSEAYARLFTKRRAQLTYWKKENVRNTNFLFPPINALEDSLFSIEPRISKSQDIIDASWRSFLNVFKDAQQASPLLSKATQSLANAKIKLLDELSINANNLIIVGKTGSPDNFRRIEQHIINRLRTTVVYDEGLYAFSIMDSTDYYSNNNVSGITGVIFIRHISTNKKLLEPHVNGINSAYARDFLTPERFENIILMNKRRLKINSH